MFVAQIVRDWFGIVNKYAADAGRSLASVSGIGDFIDNRGCGRRGSSADGGCFFGPSVRWAIVGAVDGLCGSHL